MGCAGSKSKSAAWRELRGDELEQSLTVLPDLGDAPIRLVDARYVVRLAKKGGRLPRRQELPAKAILSLEQVKSMGRFKSTLFSSSLRIIAVSHPWLQPDHPDPRGENLQPYNCTGGPRGTPRVRRETFSNFET